MQKTCTATLYLCTCKMMFNLKLVHMTELAKWAWLILLCILFLGEWTLVIIVFDIIVFGLVAWLKPEWLEKF